MSKLIKNKEYKEFIKNIKSKIQISQIKAHIQVNKVLLMLYWDLGGMIIEKQKQASWGDGLIKQISKDLQAEFPNIKGFSVRNILYMKKWFQFYSIMQQAVAQLENPEKPNSQRSGDQLKDIIFQIPWGHNIAIITKCKSLEEAGFYVIQTIQNNYSRAELILQIKSESYTRQGKSFTNFQRVLPEPYSNLAIETLKNPYNFDFLNIRKDYDEKELEDALMDNLTGFLLELGQGFSFVGRQYKLIVAENHYKIDLLFYHIKLHSYVVVELKTVDFKPEFVGKLNFYVSAIDGEIKGNGDNPTIGLLICKSKKDTVVEYSFKDINKPLGISEYQLTHILPDNFKLSLPTIEAIEAELEGEDL